MNFDRLDLAAPAVSVIIPTYQRRELVREAVESVLAQTYPDLEAIVVDDGSTDGTGDALAGLDERVRYQWQENRGVSAARNTGLRLARGNVVAFLDSDNRWLSNHLEIAVGALERYPEAVLSCTCPHFRVRGGERPEDARLFQPLPQSLISNYVGFTSCIAVRRTALDAAGGFDERLAVGEDNDLWARLSLLGPFSFVSCRTLVRHRVPGSLLMEGWRRGEYMRSIALSAERVLTEVQRMPDARARGLLEPAEAAVHYARALDAIARRDADSTRAELAEACRLMPELSRLPHLVHWRIWHTAGTRAELCESFRLAGELWPDRRSDTALTLRTYALARAIRAGRVGVAVRLAVSRPFLFRPRIMRLILPATARHARFRVRRAVRRLRTATRTS